MKIQNSTLNKVFSKNLRHFRIQAKLSQEDLSDKCGLHRTYVGSIERGERNVTLKTVEKFAKALSTSPIKLLSED